MCPDYDDVSYEQVKQLVRDYFLDAAQLFNDAFEPTICTFSVGYVYVEPSTGKTRNAALSVRYPALSDA